MSSQTPQVNWSYRINQQQSQVLQKALAPHTTPDLAAAVKASIQVPEQSSSSSSSVGGSSSKSNPASKPFYSSPLAMLDDCGICCTTMCFPCITYGGITAVVKGDGASCWLPCFAYFFASFLCMAPCIAGGTTRRRLRAKYGISEGCCNDYVMHLPLFTYLSLCQEARELRRWRLY